MDYYNVHLRKTSDPALITKPKLERGMVVKMKYKKDKETKLYVIFVLQPKWPNSSDGKLHCLSLNVIPPNKVLEIAEIYDEVMATSTRVRKLNLPKIQINEASVKELSAFPYFKYPISRNIVVYRSMNGDIKLDDLTKIKGMPIDKIKIIALYLDF